MALYLAIPVFWKKNQANSLKLMEVGWSGLNQAFFNIFEKTQARKNTTAQKTQRFFRPKLNELVAIVVT